MAVTLPTTRHASLTAGAVATVTIDDDGLANYVAVFQTSGDQRVYFRTDGTDPTAGGADGDYCVLPGGRRIVKVPTEGDVSIKLRSAADATVELEFATT